jgi:Rrf2 family transcriptional regulator, nitric oxide-sensitive transcriptional repressor
VQLTLFSDYSLRLLLYLAVHTPRLVPAKEVAQAYGISSHHVVKIVQLLVDKQLVTTVRGRGGGLRLNRLPQEINVGEIVRLTEPHFNLVECFDRDRNTCPIEPACGLKGALREAHHAFLNALDRYTLADFAPRGPQLIALWKPMRASDSTRDRARPARRPSSASPPGRQRTTD